MHKRLDPGPPLVPEDEFCACQPPGPAQYLWAIGASFLVALGGAIGWLTITVATQRMWTVTLVLIGLCAGWAVNKAAGRLRSVGLGVIAVVAAVIGGLGGYALLWLPFIDSRAIDRQLDWEHLLILALAGFIAYRMSGPKSNVHSIL
jgi:hypothetical protein